ncbi:MAG: TetR/AcrR family transcriptional regulator [Lentisphaeria bacterium]|nr:TetR/AcrR family transcriptional regulator [Lentisphaeria bacterium]
MTESRSKRQGEIIDHAIELIAAGGIQNLTIKNLSLRLGVTEPAIYRHFANKFEIVQAMIASFDEAADNEITAADRAKDGLDGVMAFVESRFRLVVAKPSLAQVMFAEEIFMNDAELSAQMLAMMHKHMGRLRSMLLAARQAGEVRSDVSPDIMLRLIMGPVRLLIKQWGMSGYGFDLASKGHELIDALRKTLR